VSRTPNRDRRAVARGFSSGLGLAIALIATSAAALPFDAGDLVYHENLNSSGLPTSPELDTISAGGLVAGGSQLPTFSCPAFSPCHLELDVTLASPGVANSYAEMAGGTIGTASFGVDANFDGFFLSNSGNDSAARIRVWAIFASGQARVELVRDRQGVDEYRLVIATSTGSSASLDVPQEVADEMTSGGAFELDFTVDRTGHWILATLDVTGFATITTPVLNFNVGTDPLASVLVESQLTNGVANPTLLIDFTDFEVYLPSVPARESGLVVSRLQQIHNKAGWLIDPGSPGTNSGINVLSDGNEFGTPLGIDDLDGDGVDDLIVGATEPASTGELFVLFLNTDGTVKGRQQFAAGSGGDRFGADLHWLGPLSPGGAPFLAVGAPDRTTSGTSGSVFMLEMTTSGTVQADHEIADGLGGFPSSSLSGLVQFGHAVGSPGDLDGDGIPELAVGAPLDDQGGSDRGSVWILFLDSSGHVKATPAPVHITSTTAGVADGDRFGNSVEGLGDLDGPGPSVAALAVGSPGDGASGEGSVTILFLDAAGAVLSDTTIDAASGDLPAGNPIAGANFGWRIAQIGDVDQDGRGELAVGAPNEIPPSPGTQGTVWLLFLDAAGDVTRSEFLPEIGSAFDAAVASGDGFGFPGGVGDLDGNGIDEIAIGAPWDRNVLFDREGAVHVVFLDEATCGDGRAATLLGEQCDDGNTTDGDGCSSACIAEFCGDGVVMASLSEQCDDGNTSSEDGCSSTCQVEFCGDGIAQAGLGESCDDGNNLSDDGCSDVCIAEVCGDGIVHAGIGETCDDGNTTPEDGCSDSCVVEVCGDGVLQAGLGESCDDGNTTSEDGCSDVCIAEFCGDGDVQAGLGETCDDGNAASFDGCSAACTSETVVRIVGTATGGVLDYTIAGVTVSISTSAGQTATDVATALAPAIDANATLAGLGITADTSGDVLAHGGTSSAFDGDEVDVALATNFDAVLGGLSMIPRTLDFEGLLAGSLVADAASLEGITFGYGLSGETARVTDVFVTKSPTNSLGLTGLDEAFLDGDVIALTLPRPLLALGLYIVTSDPAEAGEIRLTTPQGTSTNSATPLSTTSDGGFVYFLGHVATTPFSQATLDFAADGDIHFVYTIDDLTAGVPTVSTSSYAGVAVGGHVVGATVDGVLVQLTTVAGQTAAQIAQALADAINGDPTLKSLGTAAAADGNSLLTNGVIAMETNDDPGLVGLPPHVPSLAPSALAVLAILLAASASRAIRRKSVRTRRR